MESQTSDFWMTLVPQDHFRWSSSWDLPNAELAMCGYSVVCSILSEKWLMAESARSFPRRCGALTLCPSHLYALSEPTHAPWEVNPSPAKTGKTLMESDQRRTFLCKTLDELSCQLTHFQPRWFHMANWLSWWHHLFIQCDLFAKHKNYSACDQLQQDIFSIAFMYSAMLTIFFDVCSGCLNPI